MSESTERQLEEINGMLSAYRNGWIEYDRAHVQQLQAERIRIEQGNRAKS